MAANPGLTLEALPEDTLSVSNVPQSMDGWSVQARFDGPGGTAMTSPATITVDNTFTAYGSVISNYYRAYSTGNNTAEYALNNGLSEYIGNASHVGYALQDLNGDGKDELLIAGILDNQYTELVLFDVYTLDNGQPVQLASSRARSRWFLRSDFRPSPAARSACSPSGFAWSPRFFWRPPCDFFDGSRAPRPSAE
jgi:hypothetical protein